MHTVLYIYINLNASQITVIRNLPEGGTAMNTKHSLLEIRKCLKVAWFRFILKCFVGTSYFKMAYLCFRNHHR